MTFRTALSALTVAALVAGVPLLAAAQPVTASRPVPNPPERGAAMHHGKTMKHHMRKPVHHVRHVKHRHHAAHK
jgi:hypothetical protein